MYSVYVLCSDHPECLDFYIGQTKKIYQRYGAHLDNPSTTKCGKAVEKYGSESFYLIELSRFKTREEALIEEKRLIHLIGYENLLNGISRPSGFIMSDSHRDSIRESSYGKVLTEECKKKIGLSKQNDKFKIQGLHMFSDMNKIYPKLNFTYGALRSFVYAMLKEGYELRIIHRFLTKYDGKSKNARSKFKRKEK